MSSQISNSPLTPRTDNGDITTYDQRVEAAVGRASAFANAQSSLQVLSMSGIPLTNFVSTSTDEIVITPDGTLVRYT